MRIGYFLSCEEHPPEELVRQARLAADAGFEGLWISDHYHPWNHEQGQSPFVWSVIGAVSQVCDLPITTAVTCPTVRIHPAIIAQAAATTARMCRGGFRLGVGSGEALNEHVTGSRWPTADVRLEMLEEAVDVIRRLLTGERVTQHGRHYTVEDARIFTLPDRPVEIPVSGFGPEAVSLAARIGDGFVTTQPDAESLASYREQGGKGPAMAGAKACWGPDREQAQALAHRLWANAGVPGELAQVLPSPAHFEQASSLVTPEMVGETMPCGPDVEEHVTKLAKYAEAGFDELYVAQVGPDQDDFFRAYEAEVLPALRRSAM
ncbi:MULTISPECIES: TIGR03557 family F420-dependent LLM class oxidoreductase [unclassified Nocardioides]|uniref:TIGR03557 family F420-dependent LLM class oxidoreductase n=1 Tax=unclassified Nocardioides TaxID=2615069 RepID=UPI000056F4C7|nr:MULTISPECIES: TIGR03557 family F420-dependent LLM class oxidoreductase [unclassified Nocardioides]ABL83127.1 dehydrogenase [Nocardioides sp. JS614]